MSLLNFLVTSQVRRSLLNLLWAEGVTASGHQLALLSNSAYSAVHGELELMTDEGLVTSTRVGRSYVFARNDHYPQKRELLSLLGVSTEKPTKAPKLTDDDVRANLAQHGAPIVTTNPSAIGLSLEDTLVHGMALARRDSTVARALPVAFARNRKTLDLARMEYLARKHKVLPILGFYLELTSTLSRDRQLHLFANTLKDKRRKKVELFFKDQNVNKFELALHEANSPRVARNWCFLMNLGMDSFESLFKRYVPESGLK